MGSILDNHSEFQRHKNRQGLNRAGNNATSKYIREQQAISAMQARLREIVNHTGMHTYCGQLGLRQPDWVREEDIISVRTIFLTFSDAACKKILDKWQAGDENAVFTKLLREALKDSRNFT